MSPPAKLNKVRGNLIGTDWNGTQAVSNRNGVRVDGADENFIGGLQAGARNVISGNAKNGIFITMSGVTDRAPVPEGNEVYANYVGTKVDGLDLIRGNYDAGVAIETVPAPVEG